MKPEKRIYLSEMAAAGAAVAVFVAVYVIGFVQAGLLVTLLVGWAPATALAWVTARALRSAAQTVMDLSPAGGFALDDDLQPISVRTSRRRERGARSRWRDDR